MEFELGPDSIDLPRVLGKFVDPLDCLTGLVETARLRVAQTHASSTSDWNVGLEGGGLR